MKPRCVIIKTQSLDFFTALLFKIKEIENLRFFNFKINGLYTIVIKCHNYYNKQNTHASIDLYGNYIFIYSVLSIIISELLISYYEHSVSRLIIHKKKLQNINISKLSNISSLLLDKDSPIELSKKLYNKRKNSLISSLFKNFRKQNYIYIDNYIIFTAKDYLKELESLIDKAIEILLNIEFSN